jgi:hypothetical protein
MIEQSTACPLLKPPPGFDGNPQQTTNGGSMKMKRSITRILALALAAAGPLGCDSAGPATPPSLPQSSPAQEIKASPESTRATGGVVQWKIYDKLDADSTHIYGVDGTGRVLTVSRIGGDPMSTAEAKGVTMESVYPEPGRVALDGSGNVVARELSPAAAATFGAMAQDFQHSLDVPPGAAQVTFACIRAGVILGAACGAAIAGCVESGGLGCPLGGALCIAAWQDWLCACHNRCP